MFPPRKGPKGRAMTEGHEQSPLKKLNKGVPLAGLAGRGITITKVW